MAFLRHIKRRKPTLSTSWSSVVQHCFWGVQPYCHANAGESIRHVQGKTIKTGEYDWSDWSAVYSIKKVHDDEDDTDHYEMEQAIISILALCEAHQELIQNVLQQGGVAEIVIRLDGMGHIGDSLQADTLRRIAALGMSLGIEVFP